MNTRIANDLIRYAELVEDRALISPEEMNCASVMRLAAEYLVQPAVAEQHKQSPTCGEPVAIHQFRSPYSSDWYDGVPDHHDGHGPYEVRTLYTTPPPVAEPHKRKPLTDEMIVAGGKALAKLHSESCGLDFDDVWKYYAEDHKADAKAAIEAAHGIHPTGFKE